jgi:AcrR family transcriptional regulator
MSEPKKAVGGRKKNTEQAYHHGDLRRALLDAAMQLVTVQGVKGFTLREAAREAGVSHNAPYRHFASRADILVALALEGQRKLMARMEAAVAKGSSQRQRLERLAVAYLEFAAKETPLFRVMFSADVNDAQTPELVQAQADTLACFEREVLSGEKSGLLQAGKSLVFLVAGWSAMHGAATLLIDGVLGRTGGVPHRAPEKLAMNLMDTLFDGMLRRTGG